MTVVLEDDAATAFCRSEHRRLVSAMTLYTGDRDLAAELAQEALARAFRDWKRVSDMPDPGAWTYRVARNLANSHFRRRRYERAARDRAAVREAAAPDPAGIDEVVLRALRGLPRRQREAVVLRFLLDLSVETTAERMSCASGTVRALTSQAMTSLRQDPALADLQENADA